MLIEFEFSVSLISAEPRCWRPNRTPVQALGRLVRTASTTTPTSASGTDHASARSVAACTAPTLPATIRQSATRRTRSAPAASRRESSAGARRCASPKLRWTKRDSAALNGSLRARRGPAASSATYGTATTATSAPPVVAPSPPATTASITASSQSPTNASSSSVSCRARTRPATTALTPSIAARLNAFEPTTTPTATACSCWTSAAIADETSGASAASAVSRPSSASGRPSRRPMWSSRRANTADASSISAMEATKSGAARAGVIGSRRPAFPAHRVER